MTANLLPSIFTLIIDDKPTLIFQVRNLREAYEICREQWLKDELCDLTSGSVPICTTKSKLRARIASEDEATK